MLQAPGGGYTGPRGQYVPGAGGSRQIYRSSYIRPLGDRYGPRQILPPITPVGAGPGGTGALAGILGPIGGLTGCLCCLNTISIWGLFITAIPLTVFISQWLRDYRSRNGLNGADELVVPHMLLLLVLEPLTKTNDSLGAVLGPIGALAACSCCLIVTAIWGLFATMIALAVYTRGWADAVRQVNGLGSGAEQIFYSHALLIIVLCVYGYLGIRRAICSAN
ncbi:unnamed protein product [Rotaria sordida]|uniref:Uncharacterized protein n=1 Tax=Rotaria sordida TaxID=392033 RepID=A0A814ATU6_9BILA|nr:unnamed protein product [Rotaria sordida]CAF1052224.1 unnamed protein product [Rotaria sordida]